MLPFVPQAPSVTLRVPPPSRREAKITPLRHIKLTDKSKFEIDKLMFCGGLYLSANKQIISNIVGRGLAPAETNG